MGYRWTDRQKKQKPTFAFGHGLSYTTFEVGKVRLSENEMTRDGELSFLVPVKNTGSRAGAEVLQLYVSDKKASVERPVKELKAFRKVFLQPGEEQLVKLTIGVEALSFYDEATQQWKAEDGDFEALIGTASDNIATRATFRLR